MLNILTRVLIPWNFPNLLVTSLVSLPSFSNATRSSLMALHTGNNQKQLRAPQKDRTANAPLVNGHNLMAEVNPIIIGATD